MKAYPRLEPSRRRRFALVLAIVTVGATLVGAELIARAIPGPWQPQSAIGYTFDREVGLWLEPGPRDVEDDRRGLEDWHVNAFGMQDDERELEKPPGVCRVVVLGDSFMEGRVVGMNQRLSSVLQQQLGSGHEVMNFAVSSLGTTQEMEIFRFKARQFAPDLVVLGFNPGNDLRNNSRELEIQYGHDLVEEAAYHTVERNGEVVLHPPLSGRMGPAKIGIILALKRSYALRAVLYLRRELLSRRVPPQGSGLFGHPWPRRFVDYGVYSPPRHRVWEDAWTITEHALSGLAESVGNSGAELLVLVLTSDVQLVADPASYVQENAGVPAPEDFDPAYPNRRVCDIARGAGASCLDILPLLEAYRDSAGLAPPYFWFENDEHWNPLAHRLAAAQIAWWIREDGPKICRHQAGAQTASIHRDLSR